MDIQTAINNRRTIRRFQNKPVADSIVSKLVDLSRLYASGANLQPIRYIGVTDRALRDQVFKTLRWAGYLPGFEIRPDQRPMAYVILTCDVKVRKTCQFDVGAAATTLMLAAEGEGLGTCCLGSFTAEVIQKLFDMEQTQVPVLVIALGYPDQKSTAVDMSDDAKYYEAPDGTLCVPKRKLQDILKMY